MGEMRKSRILKYVFMAAALLCLCMLMSMKGTSLAAIQESSGAVVNTFTAPEQSESGDGDENGGDTCDDDGGESESDTDTSDDASSDSDEASTGEASGAQTGDSANMAFWACIAVICAAAAGFICRRVYKEWTGKIR